ncbi:ATP-binding protein [Photobacterium sp.]|uniref:AAA family ATPase n=1 Tax=Photobacterium sp. TaxID=660 RepID=UPI00299DB33A|nr:ATP-binding protein [Photobacterium sp.]MDX1301196.1 ATP-binding protein [Photobacterium sp.]
MDSKILLNFIDTALSGDVQAVQMSLRKLASKIRTTDHKLYEQLTNRLSNTVARSVQLKKPVPVDSDSRQNLVRIEQPALFEQQPIHDETTSLHLNQIIRERFLSEQLLNAGLQPTKSIIFSGPPGVGKTMSARWLASKLELPLLILDLATVMSSFLGKTGSNIRAVLDHASSYPCVLLLDEFDAIAKRRDDDRELGELKRLVTVLLQSIDDWPVTSVLIAATNHGELLDPAIWRRFDSEINFELPTLDMREKYIEEYWPEFAVNKTFLSSQFDGSSYSDMDRSIKRIKRESILSNMEVSTLVKETNNLPIDQLSMNEKKRIAVELHLAGESQRTISEKLSISRPTVKKAIDSAKIS